MTSRVDVPVIISGFDHVVLTVANLSKAISFYEGVLGMRAVATGPGRMAVVFGDKTIGLHGAGLDDGADLGDLAYGAGSGAGFGSTAGFGSAAGFGSSGGRDHGAGADGAAPRPRQLVPGSAEVCLVTSTPLEAVAVHLAASGVPIEAGPVRGDGACGPVTSVYVRDPDGNLIEIASYDSL